MTDTPPLNPNFEEMASNARSANDARQVNDAHPAESSRLDLLSQSEPRTYDFRSQQMAALYEIGLSITAQLDLEQVLYSLYDHVQNLLDPEVFYIGIYDENTHLCEFPLFFDQGSLSPMPARDVHATPGLTGAVILGKQTLVVNDLLDPSTAAQYHTIRTGGEPTRSYVGVPMIVHNRIIGVISMQKYAADAFTAEQIRLLETIAIQAAIAIENSQLFEKAQVELEQRRETQAALERVNQQLQEQIKKIE